MTITFKNMFNKKLTKYTGLLLILIFILIIFILNIDNIMNYLGNKHSNIKIEKQTDSFNNIGIQGYDNSGTNRYLQVKEGFINKEHFIDTDPEGAMEKINDRNYKVIIEPKTRSVNVSFKGVDSLSGSNKIQGYLLILAKYNSSLEKVGHVNARISSEGLDIESFLNDLASNGYISTDNQDKLRDLLRGDLTTVTSTDVLKAFQDDGTNFTNIKVSGSFSIAEVQDKFLELLEKVYDEKYYKKALKMTSTDAYNTGIKQLYNDFNSIIDTPTTSTSAIEGFSTDTFPTLANYKTDSDIVEEQNENDRKLIIIKKNKEDAIALKQVIENSNTEFDTKLKDFIMKFLNKYERLSLDTDSSLGNGICNIDGECSYKFENLEDKDSAGNFYYYKLGIGLIYNTGSTGYTENVSNIYTYKYGPGGKIMYFKLDNSLEEQERLIRRLEEIERNSILSKRESNKPLQPMPEEGDTQSMDAYMKMLEPHIGNYPNEFTLREQDVNDLSLSNYLNKSLSNGTINVGVKINDIAVESK